MKEQNKWYKLVFSPKSNPEFEDEEIILGTRNEAYAKAEKMLFDKDIVPVVDVYASDDRILWDHDNQISR